MTTILPVLGSAFVAVCIWLGVRVVNRKERWAKWTLAAVLGMPLLYVASFVPGCWLVGREILPRKAACMIYRPLIRLNERSQLFQELMRWLGNQNDDVSFGQVLLQVADFEIGFENSDW